ncbi:MAG TPA: lysine 5,6-aminomutase subunit alpha [Ktedonobacteraceae bacterium]|jgi:beta-lysine 5,6-aminomutase alpha subunit|nr:lysine 5,6-aminomutase subunit alpha [Ktedonobacteraceae bacterium]
MPHLKLDSALVDEARALAQHIVAPVIDYIYGHTTVAIERATLRLIAVDGVDETGVPLPNCIVDSAKSLLPGGILRPFVAAMLHHNLDVQSAAEAIGYGELKFGKGVGTRFITPEGELALNVSKDEVLSTEKIDEKINQLVDQGVERIRSRRAERAALLEELGNPPMPWLYVIVATGNIYEDIVQAQAAARQGADVIAVIRSTAQSLLDYVPYGPTTEGFGGTYATQANFQLMRAALDETSREVGHYIRLTNYCSGLCMPEIAAMGALERLDMMLNDALYGIIFRDINMKRTLIDQLFSRRINAAAGIIINTGEDNYLTTTDALEAEHTVIASQFINERFAQIAGLPPEQIGLGHAFEINPDTPNHLLHEIASAQLVRDLFPGYPVKYMPPTKHMTGDIFRGHMLDSFFNLVGVLTGQGIQLLGMPTEAIHTPLLQDRFLAIRSALYVFNAARGLGEQFDWREDSLISKWANQILHDAVNLLQQMDSLGLFKGLEAGLFADIKRSPDGGRGLDGVIERDEGYFNPFYERLLG